MIGWGLYVLCNIVLAIIATPSIEILALFIFLMTMSFVLAGSCHNIVIMSIINSQCA